MNDFEEYIRQGEPRKREKGYAWQTAIGLQAVDDLKPSEYLIQTARQHIEGDNALARANYNNLSKGIYSTTEYIEAFFRNLILSEHNELKNRAMLVQDSSAQGIQSANTTKEAALKCNICTLNCTLEEIAVLNFLREQPKATQKEIAAHIGKSERTVKTITVNLTGKGVLERKNGKRNGFWKVKTDDLNS